MGNFVEELSSIGVWKLRMRKNFEGMKREIFFSRMDNLFNINVGFLFGPIMV